MPLVLADRLWPTEGRTLQIGPSRVKQRVSAVERPETPGFSVGENADLLGSGRPRSESARRPEKVAAARVRGPGKSRGMSDAGRWQEMLRC